mmetsp:Transcript_88783/g.240151  ORF Transcript_88783/g.240151 Transcript_88783/m.240151 type:complete len:360 (+) Transcript_88783:143-1222(+)
MKASRSMSRVALVLSLGSIGAWAVDGKALRTEVVLAHYEEDMTWVSQYTGKKNLDVTIYSKAAELPEIAGVVTLPLANFGRESQTFLHHIVSNYEELADWTVFSQAAPPTWGYLIGDSSNGHMHDKVSFDDYMRPFPEGRDSFFVMNSATQFPQAAQLNRLGIVVQGLPDEGPEMCPKQGTDGWTDWWFLPDHPHLRSGDMLEFYHKYIALDENDGKPLTLSFAQGARFAVSRARIQARPRHYYARLLVALSKRISPQEGYWMEAAWYDVFHPESLQSKSPLCQLPVATEVMTLGPYVAEHIHQRLAMAGADDSIDGDYLRRLYTGQGVSVVNEAQSLQSIPLASLSLALALVGGAVLA